MSVPERCPACGSSRVHRRVLRFESTAVPDTLTSLDQAGWACPDCGTDGGFRVSMEKFYDQIGRVCDFCGCDLDFATVTLHECEDFVIDRQPFNGAWGACPDCQAFIAAGDREGLLGRSIARQAERNPKTVEWAARRGHVFGSTIRRVQDGFWRHRKP